jgi:hypothetical protein
MKNFENAGGGYHRLQANRAMVQNTILAGALILTIGGCVSVKEYQKNRINDSEMDLSARKSEKFERNYYLYREGASGANGGKVAMAADATELLHRYPN